MTTEAKSTSVLLRELYDWWAKPGERTPPIFLNVDLNYERGHGGLKGLDFVWWVEQKPKWRELRVLETVVHDDKAALVFEGIDGATHLKVRVSWMIEVGDGKIVKIVETNAHVD